MACGVGCSCGLHQCLSHCLPGHEAVLRRRYPQAHDLSSPRPTCWLCRLLVCCCRYSRDRRAVARGCSPTSCIHSRLASDFRASLRGDCHEYRQSRHTPVGSLAPTPMTPGWVDVGCRLRDDEPPGGEKARWNGTPPLSLSGAGRSAPHPSVRLRVLEDSGCRRFPYREPVGGEARPRVCAMKCGRGPGPGKRVVRGPNLMGGDTIRRCLIGAPLLTASAGRSRSRSPRCQPIFPRSGQQRFKRLLMICTSYALSLIHI